MSLFVWLRDRWKEDRGQGQVPVAIRMPGEHRLDPHGGPRHRGGVTGHRADHVRRSHPRAQLSTLVSSRFLSRKHRSRDKKDLDPASGRSFKWVRPISVESTGRVNSGSLGASRRGSPCGDPFLTARLDGEGRPLAAGPKGATSVGRSQRWRPTHFGHTQILLCPSSRRAQREEIPTKSAHHSLPGDVSLRSI